MALRHCLLALSLLLAVSGALCCTSILVGPGATVDGSVLISRNDDGDDAVSVTANLGYHPARAEPAIFRANGNSLELELPAPGLAYLALPSTVPSKPGRNISGEVAGVNSAGVAISATESIYSSAAVLALDPLVPDGIIEDVIPSVLLPQATSARHGVQLLGALVEKYGAGEGFGVLFGDSSSAWYIETAGGHHWLAQRIPADTVFVTGNQGRFQEADLADTDNVLASPGLLELAQRVSGYDPASGQPFRFAQALMAQNRHDETYSHPRIRAMQHLFAGAPGASFEQLVLAGGLAGDNMPVFLRPSRLLRPTDVMTAMRNHFDGSHHDPYLNQNPAEPFRPIQLLRTDASHVTRLRPAGAGLPDGLSAVHYVAMATPAFSPYIPILKGLPHDALPREMTVAVPKQPDAQSLFWRARRLQALVFQNYPRLAQAPAAAIRGFEAHVEETMMPAMEARYIAAVAAGDQAAADQELVAFTEDVVESAARLLDRLAAQAAEALGLPRVPHDKQLLEWLDKAAETYAFEPMESDAAEQR